MDCTIILFVQFTDAWYAMTRPERKALEGEHLQPLLTKYPSLSIRSYNSLGFDPRFSHMVVIETDDMKEYYFLIEELRDSIFLADGYLKLNRILLGYEDAYHEFDHDMAESATARAGVR